MKKILIFSLAYHPYVGGAEVAIKEITDRLPNYEYYMITNQFDATWSKEEKIGNINVRRIGNGKKWDKYIYPFRATIYAINLNRIIKFDFAWSMMAFYAGLAALLFKYNTKVPYLLTLQSGDSDAFLRKRTWFWDYYYKRIYREPKVTQVISKWLGERSRRMGNKGEILLVPNAADLNVFKNTLDQDGIAKIREELGVQIDQTMIVTTSRLVLKNGIDDLIKAVHFLVYKMGINTKLVIFGSGPDEQKLRNLAVEKKVTDNVLFMGYTDYKKLPPYVESADIFCRPSLSEGFGNSFVEAMAVGTPIIATRVGGIPDFLQDGQTGLFCEVRNPASIAEAVSKYVKNPELYKSIVQRGQELVKEKYSWDKVASQMDRVYQRMLGK
ncbi:glycosyltransferase family 4 protein [Patescibacteria group bacterium]|nr:glycosyltransferase family 4 protein [Patescibacteria group bacterium]